MTPTSIEQSKKLLELGLDPNTADLSYHEDDGLEFVPYRMISLNDRSEYLPCWSLEGLLAVMPSEIDPDDASLKYCGYSPNLNKVRQMWDGMDLGDSYFMAYQSNSDTVYKEIVNDNPTVAAYKMVCWLLEHNYIKT